MREPARLILPFVLIATLATVSGWFAFKHNTSTGADAGQAWLDGFADLVTSSRLLGARGPAALSVFPQLGTWPADKCQAVWHKSEGLGSIVVSQNLELARQEPEPCDQAQFGQLITVLRQSESVTPGAMVYWLTQRFGLPDLHRDVSLAGSVNYEWDVQYGIHIRVEEPVLPGGANTFSVTVTRFLGAPAGIPTAADGERWLDRTVALLTEPELMAAHGRQAVRLVDAAMTPDPVIGGGCATSFSTSGATVKEPFAYDKSLTLKDVPSDCEGAAVSYLSLTVWKREPVTVRALAERLNAKLGPATLNRDFRGQSLSYEWKTPMGRIVGLSEFIASPDQIFIVRVSRD